MDSWLNMLTDMVDKIIQTDPTVFFLVVVVVASLTIVGYTLFGRDKDQAQRDLWLGMYGSGDDGDGDQPRVATHSRLFGRWNRYWAKAYRGAHIPGVDEHFAGMSGLALFVVAWVSAAVATQSLVAGVLAAALVTIVVGSYAGQRADEIEDTLNVQLISFLNLLVTKMKIGGLSLEEAFQATTDDHVELEDPLRGEFEQVRRSRENGIPLSTGFLELMRTTRYRNIRIFSEFMIHAIQSGVNPTEHLAQFLDEFLIEDHNMLRERKRITAPIRFSLNFARIAMVVSLAFSYYSMYEVQAYYFVEPSSYIVMAFVAVWWGIGEFLLRRKYDYVSGL